MKQKLLNKAYKKSELSLITCRCIHTIWYYTY